MKTIITIIVLFILGGLALFVWNPDSEPKTETETETETSTQPTVSQNETEEMDRMAFSDGQYDVIVEESSVRWAGKKPLIEGYVNSGSFALSGGTITVDGDSVTGEFTIDMNTLSVSDTPTKPGMENTLESHLKGDRWFDVEQFPTASFVITEVVPTASANATFEYEVTGDLTMKGVTNELTFPAVIYTDEDNHLRATAALEFDRTLWGITAGSSSFFDNLADNMIDDMVALSFELVAE